jgi:hypothetical protein
MNKFIDFIIAFSLKRKYLILVVTLAVVVMGVVSFRQTPIDAFPDVTNTKVTIITQWPGRSAEEIEKFVTIPIEIAMNSVQKKTDIRSSLWSPCASTTMSTMSSRANRFTTCSTMPTSPMVWSPTFNRSPALRGRFIVIRCAVISGRYVN